MKLLRKETGRKAGKHVLPVTLWPFPVALMGIVACGAVVTGGVALLLWLVLHRPRMGAQVLTAADQLDLVRIALIVTGGLGGVVALVVAYRKQRIAEDANRREDTKLFNERYVAANVQLGHEKAAVRIGAVYALAGLADDWPAGRQTCLDVLCAYLRMPYQPDHGQPDWKEGEREVRLSIIRIIRDHLRLDPEVDARSWRGRDLDFTGAVFDGGDFTGVHFAGGTVRFTMASFPANDVAFSEATFSDGTVWFNVAAFSGGRIWFDGTTFSGGAVRFDGGKFCAGLVSFDRAAFSAGSVTFAAAQFSGAEVRFTDATFAGCDLDLSRISTSDPPPKFPSWATTRDDMRLPHIPSVEGTAD